MLKRNLLLGLMVFMVGVLITACGDKNNTTNTTTENKLGDTFEDNRCENCTRTYDGTFRILDEDLYLQAFDHRTGFDLNFNLTGGDTFIDRVFNEVAGDAVAVGTGVFVCSGKIFLTELIADIFNVDDVNTDCDYRDVDVFDGFNNGDELSSSYNATLRVRYERGEAEAVELTIENVLDGDDREVFYYDRSNVFVNRKDNMVVTNTSGRVRLATVSGQVIGEFRD